nr:PREDICTED: centrosomal protein of 72 kDa isoform X1 [Lepisosteus oculatus]
MLAPVNPPTFERMAADGLLITEQWIRERLQLQHRCLADVRSLSLPGSYDVKIAHVGNSLKNFVHLKNLDLSRNALVSIEGIQHLKKLEKLNLYYNCIPSLKAIFTLRKLTALKELDLRLNPVTKNDPDYRLYIVHMLPNLRKLDDHPVRDSERKAAVMHFTSEQAFEHQHGSSSSSESSVQRSGLKRASSVRLFCKKRSVLDEDDEAVLNLVAKSNWDLSKPAGLTGSTKKVPEVELYRLRGYHGQDTHYSNGCHPSEESTMLKQDSPTSILRKQPEMKENQPQATVSSPRRAPLSSVKGSEGMRVTFAEPKSKDSHSARQWEFEDKAKPGYSVTVQGHFTPHPAGPISPGMENKTTTSSKTRPSSSVTSAVPRSPAASRSRKTAHRGRRATPSVEGLPDSLPCQKTPLQSSHGPEQSCHSAEGAASTEQVTQYVVHLPVVRKTMHSEPLELLLDQVDKFWNGKGSLHCNENFLTKAVQILSLLGPSKEQDSTGLEDEMKKVKEDNQPLSTQIEQQEQGYHLKIQNLTTQLSQARNTIDTLDKQLKDTLEENVSLHKQLIKMEQKLLNGKHCDESKFELLEHQNNNQNLRREVEGLKQKLQHFERVQEIALMLQESHRSLVSTNKCLLAELEDTRSRHKAEVEQLHFSYKELKKILGSVSSLTAETKTALSV